MHLREFAFIVSRITRSKKVITFGLTAFDRGLSPDRMAHAPGEQCSE
jgi:hypothetical protein